jgi:hypothetical protein
VFELLQQRKVKYSENDITGKKMVLLINQKNHSNARFQAFVPMYWRPSLVWDVTHCRLVVGYRRFGRTYLPNLPRALDVLALEWEPIGSPETSVVRYKLIPHNNPEHRRPEPYKLLV